MTDEKFQVILPMITADLCNAICKEFNVSEEDAMQKLYSSHIYELLEKEDTKVWHYSTHMLLELYKNELKGELDLPPIF